MWFNLNWSRLAIILTPTFLRSVFMNAWLQLQVDVIDEIHYQWMQMRGANIYNLAHNSQICYLRAALNDRFDIQQRRIIISSGNAFTRQYIYTDGEKIPKYLGVMFLYDDADYEDTGVDFIVKVPVDVYFSPPAMRALIDYYKLASKRYKIERF